MLDPGKWWEPKKKIPAEPKLRKYNLKFIVSAISAERKEVQDLQFSVLKNFELWYKLKPNFRDCNFRPEIYMVSFY